jgi:phospholipid/cholesterol/gamma-HCH transport system substrate-binding protein
MRGDALMKANRILFIKITIFAAMAALLTVALGVKLANARFFAHTYDLEAAFDNANGVLAGDAVKLAGVDVGRVTGTRIEKGQAIVSFNIDDAVELPRDSTVGIRWRNVLGQRFLYVYPGDEDEVFADGEQITTDNTEDVNDVGELLNKVGPILKAIDPDEANAFLDAVNTALQGNEVAVRQLIDDGAELVETLAAEDDTIAGLLDSADTVTAAYASQDDALGQIFDNLDTVGVVLERRLRDVNSLVTDFSVVQRELDEIVTENRDNIDSTLGSLDTLATMLAKDKARLAETLRTLPLGVISYQQTSSWGEFFNVRIVRITIQDPDSNILVDQSEAENQHSDEGGSPQTGNGEGDGYPQDDQGDDQSDDDGDGSRTYGNVSEGIASILRFVLLGGGS